MVRAGESLQNGSIFFSEQDEKWCELTDNSMKNSQDRDYGLNCVGVVTGANCLGREAVRELRW